MTEAVSKLLGYGFEFCQLDGFFVARVEIPALGPGSFKYTRPRFHMVAMQMRPKLRVRSAPKDLDALRIAHDFSGQQVRGPCASGLEERRKSSRNPVDN